MILSRTSFLILLVAISLPASAQVDIVFGNESGENRVCLGDEAGGFSCNNVSDDGDSTGMDLGDMNGDGNLDAIFVTGFRGPITCLGDENGGFSSCVDNTELTSARPFEVEVGDVNGDSLLDAVYANADGHPNNVCLGDGTGGFSSCAVIIEPSDAKGLEAPPYDSFNVALGDLDGDNDLDAVFANLFGQPNHACLNDGTGFFSCSLVDPGNGGSSYGVALGDMNNDSIPDAVFANQTGPRFICLGTGDGSFMSCNNVPSPPRSNFLGVALGMVDSDDNRDAIFSNFGPNDIEGGANQVCLGDGAGGFSSCSDISSDTDNSIGVDVGFINADANLDVVFANNSSQANHVCLGDGSGSFSCSDVSSDTNMSFSVGLGELGSRPISLVGLEVVQVVQDWQNSVPLVADKPTIVRAHIQDASGPPVSHYTFRLRGFDDTGQPLIPPFIHNGNPASGQSIQLPPSITQSTRRFLSKSVNFYLPPTWINEGLTQFLLEWPSSPNLSCEDMAPPVDNDCAVSVRFVRQKPIVAHMIRTLFDHLGGITHVTDHTDSENVCSQIQRRYPSHQVSCVYEPDLIFLPPDTNFPTSQAILDEVQSRKLFDYVCLYPVCEDFYVAVTGFRACKNAGCSNPGVEGESTFSTSIIGLPALLARSAWAVSGGIDASAAPHELGHNLDLRHTTIQDMDPNDDIKEGTCEETADESAVYPPSGDPFFPYYTPPTNAGDPLIGPVDNDENRVYGYDVFGDNVIPDIEQAMMSYCSRTKWPAISSYEFIFDQLRASPKKLAGTFPENAQGTEFYYVSGAVDRVTNQAVFGPVETVVPPFVPAIPPVSEWMLRVHSSIGPDVEVPTVARSSPNNPSNIGFHAFVEVDSSIVGFSLSRDDVLIDQISRSNAAPNIDITSPMPGTLFYGQDLLLEWNAFEDDGDELTYKIMYSSDSGISWVTLSGNWPSSPFIVDSELIQESESASFRVIAHDGFNSSMDTMDGTFVVDLDWIFINGFEDL